MFDMCACWLRDISICFIPTRPAPSSFPCARASGATVKETPPPPSISSHLPVCAGVNVRRRRVALLSLLVRIKHTHTHTLCVWLFDSCSAVCGFFFLVLFFFSSSFLPDLHGNILKDSFYMLGFFVFFFWLF